MHTRAVSPNENAMDCCFFDFFSPCLVHWHMLPESERKCGSSRIRACDRSPPAHGPVGSEQPLWGWLGHWRSGHVRCPAPHAVGGIDHAIAGVGHALLHATMLSSLVAFNCSPPPNFPYYPTSCAQIINRAITRPPLTHPPPRHTENSLIGVCGSGVRTTPPPSWSGDAGDPRK